MTALTAVRNPHALLRLVRIRARKFDATRTLPLDNMARSRAQSLLAGTVYREGRGMIDLAPGGDHRPTPLCVPLLDLEVNAHTATRIVTHIEVTRCIDREGIDIRAYPGRPEAR